MGGFYAMRKFIRSFYPLHPFVLLAGVLIIIAQICRLFVEEIYLSRGYYPVVMNISVFFFIIGIILTFRRVVKNRKQK